MTEPTCTVCLQLDAQKAQALHTALEDSREALGAIVLGVNGEHREIIEEAIENYSEATETVLEDYRKELRESRNGETIAKEAGIEL